MNIEIIKEQQLNRALSYALGLIYPLYKDKKISDKEYIVGSVNHNPGKITEDEINAHYKKVLNLIKSENMQELLELKTNKTSSFTISPKKGFSIIIEKGNLTTQTCNIILTNKVKEIRDSNLEIKKEFVRGCFDGRSSWDSTAHYLSIDVDRNYEKQDLIIEIVESLGVHLNNNRRALNHSKNDQIRIKPESLSFFEEKIGLYSVCREKIIKKGIADNCL